MFTIESKKQAQALARLIDDVQFPADIAKNNIDGRLIVSSTKSKSLFYIEADGRVIKL